jgi:hypothetical protein
MPLQKRDEIDQGVCPLCGRRNECEHHCGGQDHNFCWCHNLSIPRAVFDLVPKQALSKACICKDCLLKHGAKVISRAIQLKP